MFFEGVNPVHRTGFSKKPKNNQNLAQCPPQKPQILAESFGLCQVRASWGPQIHEEAPKDVKFGLGGASNPQNQRYSEILLESRD